MEIRGRFDIAVDIVVLMILVATIYVTKDFIAPILLSIVLIYLLKPVYAGIFRITKHEGLSSISSMLIVFVIILAVLIGLSGVLLVEIMNLQSSGSLSAIQLSSISNDFLLWMDGNLPEPIVSYVKGIGDIPAAIAFTITPIAQAQLSGFVSSLPILFAWSLVLIFFTYYMLIDGKHILEHAVQLLPETRRGMFRRFLKELDGIYTTLFTVFFSTAIIAGSVAALGFYLIGIPNPLVWGTLVAIFALVPIPGPPGVYVPMAIYYFLINDYQTSIILLVFGVVGITLIPTNIIAPQLALKTAKIHPILTILSFIAPIFVLGMVGIIVGPMLYGLLLAIYRTEMYYSKI
jgi:predicted PurR-regulated permease PerM